MHKDSNHVRFKFDGQRRLAASILVRAFRDYLIWSDPRAKKYREAKSAKEKSQLKNKYKLTNGFCSSALLEDPTDFLTARDTVWHHCLGVDHNDCKAVLEERDKVRKMIKLIGKEDPIALDD